MKRLDPKYIGVEGHEGFQLKPLKPGKGYRFLEDGEQFIKGDQPFDAYAGWLSTICADYQIRNKHHFWDRPDKCGRWIAWRRKI